MTLSASAADDRPDTASTPLETTRLVPYDRARLDAPAPTVAPALLGAILVREANGVRRTARIVETEAYAGTRDQASHARAGRTPRTSVMFGPPGHAYVYLVYGMHHCMNVVCGPDGTASAVLIRAIEPLEGLEIMRERRRPTAGPDDRLGAGPARACQALDIDRSFSGIDLLARDRLWLATDDEAGRSTQTAIVSGPRIGVEYAGPEWAPRPWRFGIADHASLSRPFPTSV